MHVVYREQENGEWQEIYRSADPEKSATEADKMSGNGRIRTKIIPKRTEQLT